MSNASLYYEPPQKSLWKGRESPIKNIRLFEHVQCVDLHSLQLTNQEYSFAFLGFSCDEGVKRNQGRVGAREGPYSLRQALASQALHLKKPASFFDCGTICCPSSDLEAAQQALAEALIELFQKGYQPLVLGGGHEVSWGHYQALMHVFRDTPCQIVNFDAHFDLRVPEESFQGSSGTPFWQISQALHKEVQDFRYLCLGIQNAANTKDLFETARDLNVSFVHAELFHQSNQNPGFQALEPFLQSSAPIYCTLCLDVFAAAFSPGVSAPQAEGLNPWHVRPLIEHLARSGRVVSFDIAELCPRLDIDSQTARLAASLMMAYIHASIT